MLEQWLDPANEDRGALDGPLYHYIKSS